MEKAVALVALAGIVLLVLLYLRNDWSRRDGCPSCLSGHIRSMAPDELLAEGRSRGTPDSLIVLSTLLIDVGRCDGCGKLFQR